MQFSCFGRLFYENSSKIRKQSERILKAKFFAELFSKATVSPYLLALVGTCASTMPAIMTAQPM